jgi:hypothetical protein
MCIYNCVANKFLDDGLMIMTSTLTCSLSDGCISGTRLFEFLMDGPSHGFCSIIDKFWTAFYTFSYTSKNIVGTSASAMSLDMG